MTDWLPELGDDDLETLMEALEAWEQKDLSTEMFSDVIEMILPPRSPGAVAEAWTKRDKDKAERKRERAVRKERSVLLRAKLLTLRDRRCVDRVVHKS